MIRNRMNLVVFWMGQEAVAGRGLSEGEMKTVSTLRMLSVAALAVSGLAGPTQAGYVVTLQ